MGIAYGERMKSVTAIVGMYRGVCVPYDRREIAARDELGWGLSFFWVSTGRGGSYCR